MFLLMCFTHRPFGVPDGLSISPSCTDSRDPSEILFAAESGLAWGMCFIACFLYFVRIKLMNLKGSRPISWHPALSHCQQILQDKVMLK